jgi:hypothetical protein
MPCYAFAVLNILRLKVLGRTVVTMLSNLRTAILQDTNLAPPRHISSIAYCDYITMRPSDVLWETFPTELLICP